MSVRSVPPRAGPAGASARRKYERLRDKDEQRFRAGWVPLGALAVELSPDRPGPRPSVQGAIAREHLGAHLDALASGDVAVLHDCLIPGTNANIAHLAVTRQGVWVIDAKQYNSGRPRLTMQGGIRHPVAERVFIGRRDCTRFVDGVRWQVDNVQAAVPGVRVTGALCFIDADWPLIGGSFMARGVHILWPKKLARSVARESRGNVDVSTVSWQLARRFPPALPLTPPGGVVSLRRPAQ